MNHTRFTKSAPMISAGMTSARMMSPRTTSARTMSARTTSAGMIAVLLSVLLFAILAVPLPAQPAPESRSPRGFGPFYDAAHEVTLHGDIQQVVTRRVLGSPAGMHLLVAGPEGLVDAHVGPFLSQEVKAALHTGTPVQIVGAMTSLNGKSYLLARELNVGGSTVTVRSKTGFLLRAHAARVVPARSQKLPQSQIEGGAR
jgi:hypothetical protein